MTPVLHAIATQDPVVVPAQSRQLAEACHVAKVFEFSGVHYVPQSKEYKAFCKALRDFLDGVPGLLENRANRNFGEASNSIPPKSKNPKSKEARVPRWKQSKTRVSGRLGFQATSGIGNMIAIS